MPPKFSVMPVTNEQAKEIVRKRIRAAGKSPEGYDVTYMTFRIQAEMRYWGFKNGAWWPYVNMRTMPDKLFWDIAKSSLTSGIHHDVRWKTPKPGVKGYE